jgi:hypothetical protein
MDSVDLTAYSKEDIEKARRYPKVIAVFRIRMFGPHGSGSVIYLNGSDPFINKQKMKKNLNLYCFVTSCLTFYLWKLCKCTFKKEGHCHWKKEQDPEPPSVKGTDPDPYRNVTDPEHWVIAHIFVSLKSQSYVYFACCETQYILVMKYFSVSINSKKSTYFDLSC